GRMSAISGSGMAITAKETVQFSGTVASFVDATPLAQSGDFTATIDWGDGGTASLGAVSGPQGGPFDVSGVHVYALAGSYPHSIVATYAGDNRHTGSPSNSVPQIVTTVGQGPSTTTLSVTSTRITGRLRPTKATLTATVTAGATGTVSFYDGERFVGMASLV